MYQLICHLLLPPLPPKSCHSGPVLLRGSCLLVCLRQLCSLKVDLWSLWVQHSHNAELPPAHSTWLGVTCGAFLPRETLPTSSLPHARATFVCLCCWPHPKREAVSITETSARLAAPLWGWRMMITPAVTSPQPRGSRRKPHTHHDALLA